MLILNGYFIVNVAGKIAGCNYLVIKNFIIKSWLGLD